MSIKRVLEFDCQCNVYRNNIKLQVSGEKGHLRKVVITVRKKLNYQPPPELGIKLKQVTLQYLFSRQQQQIRAAAKDSKDSKVSEDTLIKEMNIYVQVYCNTDELHCFNLDDCRNLNESKVTRQVLNLQFCDKLVSFFDCPSEILEEARKILIKYNTKKKELLLLKNSCKDSSQQSQDIQPISEFNPSIQRSQQPFSNMQLLKMERRRASIPEIELFNAPQKQLARREESFPIIKKRQIEKFNVPLLIWNSIFKFMDRKTLFKVRLVNKQFNLSINLLIKKLSFSKHDEIPLPVVVRCFAKFKNVEKIISGPMRNIKPHQIIEMRIHPLRALVCLNLKDYQQLNDKLCQKIITCCEGMKKLILPYNSKITNSTIQFITKKLINLTYFKLVQREKLLVNEEISYQAIAKLVKLRRLNYLKIPMLNVDFFEQYTIIQGLEPFPSINGKLKIGTISFVQLRPNLIKDFTKFLEYNDSITKLSISDFVLKSVPLHKYSNLFDDLTFMSLKNIFYFSFGGFVDDEFCKKLCSNNIEIKKLKIRSKLITDEGLKHIFFYCKSLERIDVAFCSMISGVGFQNLDDKSNGLTYPRLEVHVSLDDYNIQCLDDLLLAKAYNYKLSNQKFLKKMK